jgi:2-C-methyl-D-erythritol 2,4-cyclodiphosphate synthase
MPTVLVAASATVRTAAITTYSEKIMFMRIGHGYDVHQLVTGRKLILGGVDIHYEKGLLGHSDADVLLHALSDAILGAIGEGDIGRHFPDSDPAYKGISSVTLLRRVMDLAVSKGYRVGNVDATIVAQRPKLAPHIPEMRKTIAEALDCGQDRVNVKATTTEELGFAGRGEGIATYAVALMEQKS